MPRPKRGDYTEDPKYGTRILEIGMTGRDVWELQIKLIGWGSGTDNEGIGAFMDPVRVTGKLDRTTADAVRRFQQEHRLPITGIVDGATFHEIDAEPARHPVLVPDLACPCKARGDDGTILCRCNKHPNPGHCSGFGNGRFVGAHLLDNHATLSGEALDLYDMKEHAGIDKAVIWAVRALLHRADVPTIAIVAGYRCWHDNYLTTDDTRWQHRRSTFHLGKTIELRHPDVPGTCTITGNIVCAWCANVRARAIAKCGFQLRWQEPDRVSVAAGGFDARPPATPFAVHIDTVRRLAREDDDFVDTDKKSIEPLYTGRLAFSYPVDVGAGPDPTKARLDPRRASSATFFDNIETKEGGGFPLGASRTWHGGVHLHVALGAEVRAIADGEVVACRVGESETEKAHGSRNFVLLRHKRKGDIYYSLYMHLDAETAKDDATVPWRRRLFLQSKDHVEAVLPSPLFVHTTVDTPKLTAHGKVAVDHEGLAIGDHREVAGVEARARTLDARFADSDDWMVVKLAAPANTYVFTKRGGEEFAKRRGAVAGLADKITNKEVIGLANPIKVGAGELIGRVGAEPTHASLVGRGPYVHVEVFSAANLLAGVDGFELVDASEAAKIADRKDVVKKLVDAALLVEPQDGVLAETDLDALAEDPSIARLRSVVLKAPNAFGDIDWKAALAAAKCFSFMKDEDRDALGDAFNDYRFWSDATGASLPGATVFHYHPVALLLHFAYTPEA
jgi:hypothetical protein